MKKCLLILPLLAILSCGKDRDDNTCNCHKKEYERYVRKDQRNFPVEVPEWTLKTSAWYPRQCFTPTNGIQMTNERLTGTDNNGIKRYHQTAEEVVCP